MLKRLSADEMSAVKQDVSQDGWDIVLNRATETCPPIGYTVGFHQTFKCAEIIVCGLPVEMADLALKTMAKRMANGKRYPLGQRCVGVLRPRAYTVFLKVDINWQGVLTPGLVQFYGGVGFPLWQLFWTDQEGKFPWEEGCAPNVARSQPRLDGPPANLVKPAKPTFGSSLA